MTPRERTRSSTTSTPNSSSQSATLGYPRSQTDKQRLTNGCALLSLLDPRPVRTHSCAHPSLCCSQFNLEIPESSLFKDNIRLYRSVSTAQSTPPFELQVLLSVPELSNNQVLVHVPPGSSRVRVDPPPKFILLETWVVNFVHGGSHHSGDVAPSTIYKLGIALFRSVYALLRILPTWKSHRPLKRRVGGSAGAFTLQLRLRSEGPDDRILAFSKS